MGSERSEISHFNSPDFSKKSKFSAKPSQIWRPSNITNTRLFYHDDNALLLEKTTQQQQQQRQRIALLSPPLLLLFALRVRERRRRQKETRGDSVGEN